MKWDNLTAREKFLDRAIDTCGLKLDSTISCARNVANAIGAQPQELSFVQERIAIRLRAQSAISQADDLISKTESMLSQFSEDDKEWERKGRSLGINLWKK